MVEAYEDKDRARVLVFYRRHICVYHSYVYRAACDIKRDNKGDMVIKILKWEGRAVGENRRLETARGRFYASANYKAFMDSMVWTFKAQGGKVLFTYPDVLIHASVGPLVDDHNLFKPILDAIERAGLVDNDRNIRWKRMAPPDRHPRGQDDEITVILTGETVKIPEKPKR